jgi:hypothetical protein
MDELDVILADATAAIEAEYFRLPIAGGDPVYRERVYCYELYHQMRSRWPPRENCRYLLNGEVDKSSHELMRKVGVRRQKPDLLVHGPGNMKNNHAVIEVKNVNASPRDIKSDLEKLTLFRNQAGYQRGIYLIYGHTADERFARRIERAAASVAGSRGVEVWLHSEVHAPAMRFETL